MRAKKSPIKPFGIGRNYQKQNWSVLLKAVSYRRKHKTERAGLVKSRLVTAETQNRTRRSR
jgi:hypothetical protein